MQDELRYEPDFRHGETIIVRVHASVQGLATYYVNSGVLHHVDDFHKFVLGFNKINSNCDFVDFVEAGNAKDGADEKVKGKFASLLSLSLLSVVLSH